MNDVVQINELHNQAMEFAEEAFLSKKRGNEEEAQSLFRRAFELEARAARIVAQTDVEPSRSVLLRSAATLALDCGETREAEKLVAIALAGDPPETIADELRDLLDQIHTTLRQKKTTNTSITHTGVLQFASSVDQNEIRIRDDKNRLHTFIVRDGLDEIVRSMWGLKVKADGIGNENETILEAIIPIDE